MRQPESLQLSEIRNAIRFLQRSIVTALLARAEELNQLRRLVARHEERSERCTLSVERRHTRRVWILVGCHQLRCRERQPSGERRAKVALVQRLFTRRVSQNGHPLVG